MKASAPPEAVRRGRALLLLAAVLLGSVSLRAQPTPAPSDTAHRVESHRADSHPLTPRGTSNLLAYSKLLGLLRYFHPSDQAAHLDWHPLVAATLDEVETAQNPKELEDVLRRWAASIAPTVRFYPTGQTPPRIALPTSPGARPTAWRHFGLQTEAGRSSSRFRSYRAVGSTPSGGGEVTRFVQPVPAEGTRVRLTVVARTQPESPQGGVPTAEIGLRALGGDRALLLESRQAVRGTGWKPYTAELTIPAGTAFLSYALRLSQPGTASLDSLAVEELGKDGAVRQLEHHTFDNTLPGALPLGWVQPLESQASGYQATIERAQPEQPAGSLRLALMHAAALPDPGDPLIVDLGAGVSAVLPIALYADANGTLPHSPAPSAMEPGTARSRSIRIANLLLLNAALTHFHPHAGGQRRIAENLSSALQAAAVAPDDRRFLDVLRAFVGSLDDGHADVLHATDPRHFRIPVQWSWVEERLAITATVPGIPEIRPGDVVLEVDGIATERAVAEAEERVSGATPDHRRYRALELLAAGKEGQSKSLRVQRGEAPPFRVTVPCNAPAFSLSSARRQSPEKVAELAPGVLYVDLDRITDQDWSAALPRIEEAEGLVFDLRGYPASLSPLRVLGRLMDRAVATCSAIPLTTRPDQPAQPVTSCRTLEPEAPRLKAPAVFLIDERAMSLAESLLQIVAENRLGVLVGSPTAGTRGEINEMALPGGFQVLWTGTLALNSDGTAFWGKGFQPAVAVRPTLEGIRNGRDEVLEAGVAWLRRITAPR